jgi:hypothetical protein
MHALLAALGRESFTVQEPWRATRLEGGWTTASLNQGAIPAPSDPHPSMRAGVPTCKQCCRVVLELAQLSSQLSSHRQQGLAVGGIMRNEEPSRLSQLTA